MNNNGWQKFISFVNGKEVGHVFKRAELLLWGRLNELASGSVDGYRNYLVQGGYFKRTKPGTYELQNKLPDGTTATEIYHLRQNDRLKYLEKVVARKERTKRHEERFKLFEARKATNERVVAELLSRPCLDCKGSFPRQAMVFSYRQVPRWSRELSKLILKDTQYLTTELEQTDVICMNCYLIRETNTPFLK